MDENHGMPNSRDCSLATRVTLALAHRHAALGRALATCAIGALAPLAAHAQTVPTDDEAFYQRAAVCAAAMEVDQLALANRLRAGDTSARPPLVDITKLGFSYVGEAYLRGLRNPRADEMLKAQRLEVKTWDAPRREKTVGECRVEAQSIFDGANGLTQSLLMNRVNKRVDKFLAQKAPASAPAASSTSASR